MKKEPLSFIPKTLGRIGFAAFYLVEIIKSNFFILWDVITPTDLTKQSIVSVDIPEEMTPTQILLVSNLVTMTPGTLCLELTDDKKKLLIHFLYSGDIEQTRKHITENYVHRVLTLF